MRTVLTVFRKEVLDSLRDRRTLMSALLMGPLFGPIIFVFMINLSLEQAISDDEKALDVPAIGMSHAPNLVAYLESNNLRVVDLPDSRNAAVESVEQGRKDFVLIIPKDFGDRLRQSLPARVEIISDRANTTAERDAGRLRDALERYSSELASLRLAARGLNPLVVRPLNIDDVDVSTPSGRSALLLGMMSYFFIFALLLGGMYLAIDSTAGERERGSLEPLLTLPVTRGRLILGKIMATCLFMMLSLGLSLAAFYFALPFMPLKELGMTPNFGPAVVLDAFLLLLPFVLVGAALMTLVASFTKSYREAQTWLSVLMLAPTLPILVVSILQLKPRMEYMFVPSLSQHLLLVDLIKNEALDRTNVLISVASTLVFGILLTWVCARLYRREGLLG
jgi:sodium transport system permease protein